MKSHWIKLLEILGPGALTIQTGDWKLEVVGKLPIFLVFVFALIVTASVLLGG